MGCYVDKYGTPSRSSGYVRWEIRAAGTADDMQLRDTLVHPIETLD